MIRIIEKLRNKLGDFWYYSLMIFCACRVADLLNAFVGLYIVPKFVDPSELGAVLPLSSFATALALPAYVFAMTFMKEVNALSARGEFGKLKSLMRGVFIACGITLVLAIGLSRLLMPIFMERFRIVEGSLGILILAYGFLGCVTPIYTNALQALKKFNVLSIFSIVSAPLRIVTMIIAMPFRALSGYFVGQCSAPIMQIAASVCCLRKELSAKAETYWTNQNIRRLTWLFLGILCYQGAASIANLVEMTILRQRLPGMDSAGYYMMTRFSDIANYMSLTLLTVMFPYTSEKADRGESTRPFVIKASVATISFSAILAVIFLIFGKYIVPYLPGGDKYLGYVKYIPWLIAIATMYSIQTFHTNTEISAGRFGFLKWWIPVHALYAVMMLLVTGYGYFTAFIPKTLNDFLGIHNISDLPSILLWFTVFAVVKLACSIIELSRQRS